MKVAETTANKQNQSRAVATNVSQQKNNGRDDSGFVDNRPETNALKSLQMMINNSPRMAAQRRRISNTTGGKAQVIMGPDTNVPNGPAESSRFIRLYAPSPVSEMVNNGPPGKTNPIKPFGGRDVLQLWQIGRAKNTGPNRATALREVDEMTDSNDLNAAVQAVEKNIPGTLVRYIAEFKLYLKQRVDGKEGDFQWPQSYIEARAARKQGRMVEAQAIRDVYGAGVAKNTMTYSVEFEPEDEDDMTFTVKCIPDFVTADAVGDVKNVASQSLDDQLRIEYAVAKGEGVNEEEVTVTQPDGTEVDWDKNFDLIVRGPEDDDYATDISGPLQTAADNIFYILTEP